MGLKIGGNFINQSGGSVVVTCEKCGKTMTITKTGEIRDEKCECGHYLFKVEE